MSRKEFFEHIETHYKSQLPFVAYRKPNDSTVKAILQKDNNIHTVNDFTESGFIFSPFDSEEKTIIFPLEASQKLDFDYNFTSEISNSSNLERKTDHSKNSENAYQQHLKLVEKGIKAINDGRFEKVVLSRVESVPIPIAIGTEENPIEIFQSLLQNYPTAFVYLWYHPEIGLWLGATPETLLQVEGQRFKTMSLAGTQSYNGTMEVDWDEKNRFEQQLVTDFVVESLQPLVSKLEATKVQTVRAGQLLHLQSLISGTLASKNLKKVIGTLHPTPAVCGLPKETTKAFILENEHYNREFYTGFLGELNLKVSKTRNPNRRNVENNAYNLVKTTSELFVNLRCMQIRNNDILIYVGGGVTKSSSPQKEWEETVAKSYTLKHIIL